MGSINFNKILDPLGILGLDKDDDKKDKDPVSEETAKTDPVDQAQVDFNRQKLEENARRSRINAHAPLKPAPTGLRRNRGPTPRTRPS